MHTARTAPTYWYHVAPYRHECQSKRRLTERAADMTSTPITVIAERRGIKRPKKIVTPTGTFALKNLLGEGGFGCGSSYTHVRVRRNT